MSGVRATGFLVVISLLAAACAPPQASPTPKPAAPKAKEKATPVPAAQESPAVGTGNPENGKQLFISKGCGGCHTIQGIQGAAGDVGPELTNVAARAGQRVAGFTAAQYLEQSIEEPDAFTVEGFQKGVMPKIPMTEKEVNDLVAYLLTLK